MAIISPASRLPTAAYCLPGPLRTSTESASVRMYAASAAVSSGSCGASSVPPPETGGAAGVSAGGASGVSPPEGGPDPPPCGASSSGGSSVEGGSVSPSCGASSPGTSFEGGSVSSFAVPSPKFCGKTAGKANSIRLHRSIAASKIAKIFCSVCFIAGIPLALS